MYCWIPRRSQPTTRPRAPGDEPPTIPPRTAAIAVGRTKLLNSAQHSPPVRAETVGRSRRPAAWLLFQQPVDHVRKLIRNILVRLPHRPMLVAANAMQHGQRAVGAERRVAGRHEIQHRAQAEQIGAMIDRARRSPARATCSAACRPGCRCASGWRRRSCGPGRSR